MTQQYSKKVLERFLHPRHMGKMKNFDGTGRAGNPICGDILEIYIKMGKKGKYIRDISFQTLGCCAAIAVSDVICDLTKGQALKNALKIESNKIVESLGGLPTVKYHCSSLGVDALAEAIHDYLSKNKKPIPKKLQERHRKIEKQRKETERKNR